MIRYVPMIISMERLSFIGIFIASRIAKSVVAIIMSGMGNLTRRSRIANVIVPDIVPSMCFSLLNGILCFPIEMPVIAVVASAIAIMKAIIIVVSDGFIV